MLVISVLMLCACEHGNNSGKPSGSVTVTPTEDPSVTGTLTQTPTSSQPLDEAPCEVHILSIGKADCILIKADGHAMLIDAGYKRNGDLIVQYLKDHGVTKLDYLILTHGDKDHVGGMAQVIRTFDVEKMLISPKKEKSDLYEEMAIAIKDRGVSYMSPAVGTEFEFGSGKFQTLGPGPKALKEGSDNDASIAIRFRYGNRSFLLMGDALSTTEKELVDSSYVIRSDVLKTGHHGKNDATNKKFLKAVQPKYGVICCGETEEGDEDGDPDGKVIELLESFRATVLRTDEVGTIVFKTDGTDLTVVTDRQ